jgi:hypothetical protein
MSPSPGGPAGGAPLPPSRHLPPLTLGEWVIFALLAVTLPRFRGHGVKHQRPL